MRNFILTVTTITLLALIGQAYAETDSNHNPSTQYSKPPLTTQAGNYISDGTTWVYQQVIGGTAVQVAVTEVAINSVQALLPEVLENTGLLTSLMTKP